MVSRFRFGLAWIAVMIGGVLFVMTRGATPANAAPEIVADLKVSAALTAQYHSTLTVANGDVVTLRVFAQNLGPISAAHPKIDVDLGSQLTYLPTSAKVRRASSAGTLESKLADDSIAQNHTHLIFDLADTNLPAHGGVALTFQAKTTSETVGEITAAVSFDDRPTVTATAALAATPPTGAVVAEPKFVITFFRAAIAPVKTIVGEASLDALRYQCPRYEVSANVRCSTPLTDTYTVGLIQLADFNISRNTYQNGVVTWENNASPMLDASRSGRPWYDAGPQIHQTIAKGAVDREITLCYFDFFSATVGWREPLPPDGDDEDADSGLRRVERDEECSTWLVARRDSDGLLYVLKKAVWRTSVDIAVDTSQPLGLRCKVKKDRRYTPQIIDGAKVSPEEMEMLKRHLTDPSTGENQHLWWTPLDPAKGMRVRLQ